MNSSTARNRNNSFHFEIPYKLVNMCSAENDTVLDSFCSLGTTNLACMADHQNSIGVEINEELSNLARKKLNVSATGLDNSCDGVAQVFNYAHLAED